MGKKLDLLAGIKVLEEVDSPINGKISVIKSLPFGTYLQVGNLTQSGGVVYQVWKSALRTVQRMIKNIDRCLILGLGGGSAVKLVRQYWPQAEITGVDLDPIMVELGRKYLELDLMKVKTEIQDAHFYCSKAAKMGKKYDLVLVDVYVGDKVPKTFESEEFIGLVKQILEEGGLAVFNRLYYDEKKPEAKLLLGRLEKTFSQITPVYPEANIMFICS